MINDLLTLIHHLENDYAKGRSLEHNLAYQILKNRSLSHSHYAGLTYIGKERILRDLVGSLGDAHVRLEKIVPSLNSLDVIYQNHFQSFYHPTTGMPLQNNLNVHNINQTEIPRLFFWNELILVWRISSSHIRFVPMVENLFHQHKFSIEKTPYWIIDLRGNSGGTDRMWSLFWPYLSSGVFMQGGTAFRVSRSNKEYFSLAMQYAQKWHSYDDASWYDQVVVAMSKQVEGSFVIPKLPGFSPTLYTQQPKANPKRFAVIIDGQTASAAETLVEMAKQSMKGIIIGQEASLGCIDSGNLRYAPLQSLEWAINFSTSIHLNSHHVVIDKSGYQPDILVPQGSRDLVIPWTIAYLQDDINELIKIYRQFNFLR